MVRIEGPFFYKSYDFELNGLPYYRIELKGTKLVNPEEIFKNKEYPLIIREFKYFDILSEAIVFKSYEELFNWLNQKGYVALDKTD